MVTQNLGLVALGLAGAALLAGHPAFASPAAPAGPTPGPTPTIDRLAAPPTVPYPNQADFGAQLFWQHCQPCHGDQAQGLTDEWRAQYPPEDQNCWNRGCHGDRPYQNGFTLPHTVPALVGAGTLNRFATAADLFTFTSHAMPFQAPGSLKPAEYWAITAFLLRGHGLPAASLPITDAASAQHIALGTPAAATPTLAANRSPIVAAPAGAAVVAAAAVAGLVVAGIGWLAWRRLRHG